MPPDPLAVAAPLAPPLQETLVEAATLEVNKVGSVITIESISSHPLLSVTVKKYFPSTRFVAVEPV